MNNWYIRFAYDERFRTYHAVPSQGHSLSRNNVTAEGRHYDKVMLTPMRFSDLPDRLIRFAGAEFVVRTARNHAALPYGTAHRIVEALDEAGRIPTGDIGDCEIFYESLTEESFARDANGKDWWVGAFKTDSGFHALFTPRTKPASSPLHQLAKLADYELSAVNHERLLVERHWLEELNFDPIIGKVK